MKDRFKKIILFVGLFILFLYSDLFYLVPLKLLKFDLTKLTYKQQLIGSNISSLIVLIIIFIIYHKYLISKFKDYKNNFSEYFDFGMKIWFIGILGMVVSNLLISSLTPLQEATNEVLVDNMLKEAPLETFISASFLAPFIEEMIFRKSLGDMFKNKKVMVIASGLVFGLLHVIFSFNTPLDFLYVIPYGFLGGAFAYIVAKKDNVLIPISFHFIHNSVLTLLSIILMGF